jgi:integrase
VSSVGVETRVRSRNCELRRGEKAFKSALPQDLLRIDFFDVVRCQERTGRNQKATRQPFDVPALNAIFSSPVYTEGFRPEGGAWEAAHWLPLLALFTGARLEELAQLRREDVYEERYHAEGDAERSAWVLRITNEGEGQGVKNTGSIRRIPLHAGILTRGFVEFVQAQAGKPRLFDRLKKNSYGTDGGLFGKWFSKYLRGKCKVTDPRMVFHSFRHGFKDLCRQAQISDEVSDALSGHVSGKVSRRYGATNYPLAPLVGAVAKIRVPGLQLPRKSMQKVSQHA